VLWRAERQRRPPEYTFARRAGNPGGQGLGFLNQQGLGMPKNVEAAAVLYREAARAGVPVSLYNLGVLYETGEGVPRDAAEAARWYQRAVDAGMDEAAEGLMRLALGATPPNDAEAARWAARPRTGAAHAAPCRLVLPVGLGRGQDKVLGVRWYHEARLRVG
jgi:hypothetical protein